VVCGHRVSRYFELLLKLPIIRADSNGKVRSFRAIFVSTLIHQPIAFAFVSGNHNTTMQGHLKWDGCSQD